MFNKLKGIENINNTFYLVYIFFLIQAHCKPVFKSSWSSSLFLQQFIRYLYKAELMRCSYSACENTAKMVKKCRPSVSTDTNWK